MTVLYGEASPVLKLHYIGQSIQAAQEAMAQNEKLDCARILLDQCEKLKALAAFLLTTDADTSKVAPADRELYWNRLHEMKRLSTDRLQHLWSQLHAWVYDPGSSTGAIGSGFTSMKAAGKKDPITQAKWELGELVRLASIEIQGEFDRKA